MTGLLTTSAAEAGRVLRAGGLVALPTETVYGLGADADNAVAVARVYTAKGRPADHPVIVHLLDAHELDLWAVDVPDWATVLAAACWPGPLTLVLRRSGRAGDHVTAGLDTVALRVPAHSIMRAVLAAFGGAIAAPSANRFGRVSPTTAQHVVAELGNVLDPRTDRVLDGGPCDVGIESTIIDATGPLPRLLRPGGVSIATVEDVLGVPVLASDGAVRAPGSLATHYAPRAKVVVGEAEELPALLANEVATSPTARVGVIALTSVDLPRLPGVQRLITPSADTDLARNLYAALRRADELGMDIVVAALPPDTGVGTAVRDRLRRAAASSTAAAAPQPGRP